MKRWITFILAGIIILSLVASAFALPDINNFTQEELIKINDYLKTKTYAKEITYDSKIVTSRMGITNPNIMVVPVNIDGKSWKMLVTARQVGIATKEPPKEEEKVI